MIYLPSKTSLGRENRENRDLLGSEDGGRSFNGYDYISINFYISKFI